MSSSGLSPFFGNRSFAFQDTLDQLEWARLSEHVSQFASTPQGRSKCRPLPLPNDLVTSNRLLEETKEIGVLDSEIDGGLSFKGVHDLSHCCSICIKGGVATGEELLEIAETLSSARRLRRQIDDRELFPTLTELLLDLATLPELEKLLKFALEEGGRIADRASPVLAGLRRNADILRLERRDLFQEFFRSHASILQDTVVAERNGRPVLAVKSGAAANFPGLVHDSSATGNTIFVEPQKVIPLGNRLVELEARIHENEKVLLAKWSAIVAEHFHALNHLQEVLLKLDLALSRARYGNWLDGVLPKLQEDPKAPFVLQKFRHPLLVWQERNEQGAEVVPIGIDVSSETRVVAITGPNTGGKTVTLKSVGLATLMARAGLFLPCTGRPTLPWCAQVLADIGDEQSLQQNLSTFSGHVKRIGRIFQALVNSPGPALVLLDEVGAGTDPTEGTAIAISILQTLADRARLTIATTHFGELKALKYSDSRFENASVDFDCDSMSPSYALRWGIPGRSNALAIAERLDLDCEVIKIAKDLLCSGEKVDMNAVICGLEEQRKKQQESAEQAAALLAQTELLHEELISRWKQQLKESADLKERGRQRIESSIQDAQQEVRALIRRLREEGANGETARLVGKRLRRIAVENRHSKELTPQNDWSPQVGERIRVIPLGKAGEVLSITDDGLYITVLCGLLRSKVHLSALESLDGRKARPAQPKIEINSPKDRCTSTSVRTTRNSVDVRGLRVHEAEVVVEEYLRKVSGPVWVIHGIGTGKLKRGLREWLETLPYVQRADDAESCDGGAGCTVVWLH